MALSSEQRRIRDRILSIGSRRGASRKEIKAALETGLVESNLRNLSGGDADSAGWRQERASIYKDPTNLDASINRFYDETRQVRDQYGSAGALAAAVQRPAAQFRGRYQQRAGEADQLLGGGGGSSSDAGYRTTTTTTPGVDNSQARASLIQSFLSDRNADPVEFALQGRALQDVAPTSTSTRERLTDSAADSRSSGGSFAKGHSPLLELIHNTGSGPGYAVKNGQKVNGPQFYSSVWAGHENHVHVAAGPQTIVELGKLAQKMGLHVGENPHFGGVNPVHVAGSYHNKGEAIDVSGDAGLMARYARRVEQLYGLR